MKLVALLVTLVVNQSYGQDTFDPTGNFRCPGFSCWRGLDNIFETDETQVWDCVSNGLTRTCTVHSTENVGAGPTYNQTFTVIQYPHNEMMFKGTLYDRHQDPPAAPLYHNGFPLDYKPPGDGDGLPDWWYRPPMATLKVWFIDEDSYYAQGHWAKPNGPHSCNFPVCERIGS